MEYKNAREFMREVFPDVKLEEGELVVIPEDILPLYKAWLMLNEKGE